MFKFKFTHTAEHPYTSLVENSLFQAKSDPSYAPVQESQVLLDPLARVQADKKTNSYTYPAQIQKKRPIRLV